MTVYPNVKLNIGLRVLGKRPDGYHELHTAFVPCYAFSDCLEIVPAATFEVEISGPEYTGWDPSEDLTARAWRLLRADFGIPPVRISLEKRSPVGAGLGGGSADGAFALVALGEMFSLGLSKEALADYAAGLGSDCAFFVYNFPMFGSGRGEVLEPLRLPLDGYRFEVAVPEGVHVSTREAYEGLKLATVEDIPDLREVLAATPIERWKDVVVNDFEASVFKKYPVIAELKEEFFRKGAVYAAMSGSGSAVFGIFRDKAAREDARLDPRQHSNASRWQRCCFLLPRRCRPKPQRFAAG